MKRHSVVLVACLIGACRPRFGDDPWLVTSTRVLAVKSEPAEAKPGAPLTFSAFVAIAFDSSNAPEPSWNFCTAPKPVTEDNVVSSACLDDSSLLPAGQGQSISAATPLNACTVFGPNTPAGGYRPRDPDPTGGYFQPLRVDLPGADPTFHLQRVLCNLADASADIATEFAMAYVPNQNPHLLPLLATIDGRSVALDAIPSGAQVELVASWPAESAESYAYFDRTAQTVTTRREGMRVAWYASGGKFDTEATGRAPDDPARSTRNAWTAPTGSSTEQLWLVLRDSRGGVDFAAYSTTVR